MKRLARLAACALALILAAGLASCRASAPHYYDYLKTGGCLALSGKLDGVSVEATLRFGARDGEGTLALCPDYTLTYSAPEALAGVRVCYEAATGRRSISLGTLTQEANVCGLDDIAEAIVRERAVKTTTREGGALVLTLDGGGTLTLDAESGQPLAASGSDAERSWQLQIRPASE